MEFINCDNPYPISQHYANLGSTHRDMLTDSAGQHNITAPSTILVNTTLLNSSFSLVTSKAWGKAQCTHSRFSTSYENLKS